MNKMEPLIRINNYTMISNMMTDFITDELTRLGDIPIDNSVIYNLMSFNLKTLRIDYRYFTPKKGADTPLASFVKLITPTERQYCAARLSTLELCIVQLVGADVADEYRDDFKRSILSKTEIKESTHWLTRRPLPGSASADLDNLIHHFPFIWLLPHMIIPWGKLDPTRGSKK